MWSQISGKCLFFVSALMPRNRKKLVFGSYKNLFTDNSKYLFLEYSKRPAIKAIWITGDANLVASLRSQGLAAHKRWSLTGCWHALTAGVYCYSTYIGDINQWLGKGALRVNLWHGTPIKEIEFDISSGPLCDLYQQPAARWQSWRFHQQHLRPDLMLAPSEQVAACFLTAFRLQPEQVLLSGNPRTDFYRRESQQSLPSLPTSCEGRRLIMYAPSWRDKQPGNPYITALKLDQLSNWLAATDTTLLIRLHPNERHLASDFTDYPHIIDISQREDVYDLLPQLALLISDYSSLYIDALLFDVPLVFYRFDQAFYQQECRKTYHYADNLQDAGPVVNTFDQLIIELDRGDCFKSGYYQHGRDAQKSLFWAAPLPYSFDVLEQHLA